jgi:NRAMP (natural resistance-associated macrophage protein)-like metal ion transporter
MKSSKAQLAERELKRGSWYTRFFIYIKSLGPGLITGASDDDPSGISTYSQTGARFGYSQLWVMLFTFPLMLAIQELCARIALQTGYGLAAVIRRHYPRWVLYICVFLLVGANTVNLGADLGGMAEAARLLVPLPFIIWLIGLTGLILGLLIWVSYARYARILRFLTFSLFSYILVFFVVKQDWGAILRSTLIPTIQWNNAFLLNLVAVLGTTISPYLFFWQASQEVEEQIDEGKVTPQQRRGVTKVELKWMRADVAVGMVVSNLVAWFIIATTASTLNRIGITRIDSAAKAAEALRPVAGPFAFAIFAIGIIGTGLLAVPILAGSAAYAVADTLKLPEGLSLKLHQAPGFYAVIVLAMVGGAAVNLIGVNPILALYYTAVINGLISPPLLLMLMLIGNNRTIMDKRVNGRISNILGWATTLAMTIAAIALLLSFRPG